MHVFSAICIYRWVVLTLIRLICYRKRYPRKPSWGGQQLAMSSAPFGVQDKRWLNMHDLFIPLVNVFHLCATLYTFLHGTNIAATNTAHVSIIHEVSTKHTNTTIMRHLIFMRIFGTKLLWITFSWISHTVWCIRQSNKKKSFPINFHSWYNCVTCREKFIRIQKINKNNTFVQ